MTTSIFAPTDRAAALRPLLVMFLVCAGAGLPQVHAAEGDRNFVLLAAGREGEAVVLTLMPARLDAIDTMISLTSREGRLLAPEQFKGHVWHHRQQLSWRFDGVHATEIEVDLRYVGPAGALMREAIAITLPPHVQERVELARIDRSGDQLVLTLRNPGPILTSGGSAWLEDEQGVRVGVPLAHPVGPIAPAAEHALNFTLRDPPTRLHLHVAMPNGTTATPFEVPPADTLRLEIADVVSRDGTVTLLLAHIAGPALTDIIAHVESAEGARFGSPAAYLVGDLHAGRSASATFRVPSDTTRLRYVVEHAGGSLSFDIALRELGSGDAPAVALATDLPARDATVGGSVRYEVELVNRGADATIDLRAQGLPDGYASSFAVDGSSASTVVVPRGGTRTITVTVDLPPRGTQDVGRTLSFAVLAEVAGAEAARVPLSLKVGGTPRLDLQGENWFVNAASGALSEVTITLRNTGSAAAHNVQVRAVGPAGWDIVTSPASIPELEAGAGRAVVVRMTPGEGGSSGRYVVDLTVGASDAASRTRSLTLDVAAEESGRLGWLLGVALAGLAATALIVKLRRK